jgi:hypothetical protein
MLGVFCHFEYLPKQANTSARALRLKGLHTDSTVLSQSENTENILYTIICHIAAIITTGTNQKQGRKPLDNTFVQNNNNINKVRRGKSRKHLRARTQ